MTRRRKSIDVALLLLTKKRRYIERLKHLTRRRGLRVLVAVLVLLTCLASASWVLLPSAIVHIAFEAAVRGDEGTIAIVADTRSIAEGFFHEWASLAALRKDGIPQAISFSVKPETVDYILAVYREEMEYARQGRARALEGIEIYVPARLSWHAVQDVPVIIRRGETEVRFHARIRRKAFRWKITELPGSVPAFARLIER